MIAQSSFIPNVLAVTDGATTVRLGLGARNQE